MRNYFNGRGFTLIELLVVIAIIAVLAAILFPVFARAREKARQSTCMSNQRQIAAAVQMYVQDHEETMPDSSTVWQDIKVDNNILQCPTAGKGITNAYTYNAAKCSNVALGEIPDSAATWLTADGDSSGIAYRHTNKTVMSFVDGHVVVTASAPTTAPTTPVKLSGTMIYCGFYNTTGVRFPPGNAFDGNFATAYDSFSLNQGWVGLDFGAPRAGQITKILYCPRATLASRMKGGKFQVAIQADFSDAVTLYTIPSTSNPPDNQFTDATISTSPTGYRYFRYLGPSTASCWTNVAEIEVWGN